MKKNTFKSNISWIFIGNLLHAIFAFVINIIVARILKKEEYGIINYVASWIAFFNAFAVLGINNIINKFLNEDIDKSSQYLCSAMYARAISSIISSICVCILVTIIELGNKQILLITIIHSFSYLFAIGEVYIYWFRYKKEAKIVAIIRLIAFFLAAIIKLVSILLLKNIYLYTFGVAFETLAFSILLFMEYKKRYTFRLKISNNKIKEMLKSSYPFIFSSILVTIYAQTDKIMLKKMVGASDVASYSVAVTIASIISIVTKAIIEGFRPEIISSFRVNKNLYCRRLKQAYCVIFWLCIAYGLFITAFAKPIILILYGKKYLNVVPALSLVVWYTSFSYFGSVNNIYMVAESKEKWVQINTLVGSICNIILNFLLIPKIGIVGAALASLITQFIANFIILYFIKDLRPLIAIIIKGIAFQDMDIKSLKNILKK